MEPAPEDSFRILVSTDNHLGYCEKDPIRCNDSFTTFKEILELAVEEKVDMILLGGDLFHENKPSRHCIVRCMELLRRYTFGDRPVLFDYLSDPVEDFKFSKNPVVNYKDPNFNVSIPIFSIHGNHDDPSGLGQFCALDVLSTAGLVNFFGRTTDLKEITISPILLEKGRTKLALYGLSAIKDERLYRLFMEEKVKMIRPRDHQDEWFNIMVLHQNHAKHGLTNHIPENFLASFLNLVIWGHEHECLIEPRLIEDHTFIMQPGSSVVTSLCPGEARPKAVAILEITHDQKFKVETHKLRTVRPFIMEDLSLHEFEDELAASKNSSEVEAFVESHIERMISEAQHLLTGHRHQPKLPLIRLRIEYTDESQLFNAVRFGHKFENKVANPGEMILFKKIRLEQGRKLQESGISKEVMDAVFSANVTQVRVEDLVKQYFADLPVDDDDNQMILISERGLARAVSAFVDKADKDALSHLIDHQIKKTHEHLIGTEVAAEDEAIEESIRAFRHQRSNREQVKAEEEEIVALLNDPVRKRNEANFSDEEDFNMDDDSDTESTDIRPTSGRGSRRGGRARGSRGSRMSSNSRGRGRASSKSLESDKQAEPSSSRTVGSRRAQPKARQTSLMESFSRSSGRAPSHQRGKQIEYIDDDDDDDF